MAETKKEIFYTPDGKCRFILFKEWTDYNKVLWYIVSERHYFFTGWSKYTYSSFDEEKHARIELEKYLKNYQEYIN